MPITPEIQAKIDAHLFVGRRLTPEEFAKIKSLPKELKFKEGDLIAENRVFSSYSINHTNGFNMMFLDTFLKKRERKNLNLRNKWKYDQNYKNRKREYKRRPDVKEKINEAARIKRESDPEIKERQKKYDAAPERKLKRKLSTQQYYKNPENREKIRSYAKEYLSKPEVKKRRADNAREKRKESPSLRLIEAQRTRQKTMLLEPERKYREGTLDLLGCSPYFFKEWIEFQFEEGMNWDNYGKYTLENPDVWEVDHFIPCVSFKLDNKRGQELCFGWQNCRPMWGFGNNSKLATMPTQEEKLQHAEKIRQFLNKMMESADFT